MQFLIEIVYNNDETKKAFININDILIVYNINSSGKFLMISSSSTSTKRGILQQFIIKDAQPIQVKISQNGTILKEFSNIFNFYYNEEIGASYQEMLHFDLH